MSCDGFFETAVSIENAAEEKVTEFKEFLRTLVGYSCKVACKPNHGSIDLYIFSEEKEAITDLIELQPSGAIGVIFDFYPAHISPNRLDDACEAYNREHSVVFNESDDESESEGDGSVDSE